MSKKRAQYLIKAKMALVAIRGEKTVPHLAARYHIHPTQINSWERHLIEKASNLFGKNSGANDKSTHSGRRLTSRDWAIDGRTRFFSQKARSLSVAERKTMIGHHEKLSQSRQCHLLGIARSTYYYQPQPTDEGELILLRQMDEQYLKTPQYGSRNYTTWFRRQGIMIGRKKATSMMKKLGIISTAPKPKTSIPAKQHKKYPYLLKGKAINRPNQVWATDITYVPIEKGFGYLVAIMDWYSRKVLSWRLSNTLDADFCVQALEAAIQDHGCPQIMNSDQGVQFTSEAFTSILKSNDIQISMDGKGCYYDNIFVERLWRTVKYEHLYTREFKNLKEVRKSLKAWFNCYNRERFHQSLDDQTPDEVYYQKHATPQAA